MITIGEKFHSFDDFDFRSREAFEKCKLSFFVLNSRYFVLITRSISMKCSPTKKIIHK